MTSAKKAFISSKHRLVHYALLAVFISEVLPSRGRTFLFNKKISTSGIGLIVLIIVCPIYQLFKLVVIFMTMFYTALHHRGKKSHKTYDHPREKIPADIFQLHMSAFLKRLKEVIPDAKDFT